MSLGWEFYATELDGDPIGLLVDLDIPRGTYPHLRVLCRLHVPMPKPLTTGLTSEHDFATLEKLEDGVDEAAGSLGGRFVGRISYRKEWVFYLFLPKEEGAQSALERVVKGCGLSRAELDIEEDPEWRQYHEFLDPFPVTMRHILNRRIVAALKESGDEPNAVRPMVHEVEFPSREAAEPIRAAALERKYPTELVPSSNGVTLRITKEIQLDVESIDRTSVSLMRLSEKHGGRYLGWSCVQAVSR